MRVFLLKPNLDGFLFVFFLDMIIVSIPFACVSTFWHQRDSQSFALGFQRNWDCFLFLSWNYVKLFDVDLAVFTFLRSDARFLENCSFLIRRFRPGAELASVLFLVRNGLITASGQLAMMNLIFYAAWGSNCFFLTSRSFSLRIWMKTNSWWKELCNIMHSKHVITYRA